MPTNQIVIRGAAEHNLRGIDLKLPRDKLIVITGVSGSGKSSLAFDTLYAEGQRRYVESLSAYARQFLGQMERSPRWSTIEGLSARRSPSTRRRRGEESHGLRWAPSPRCYDHLRLLFARRRDGPIVHECGKPVLFPVRRRPWSTRVL